ncbi:hypothetical protein ACHHYP_13216 [Achlya hypogyna]|uniref:CAP-Gly domain-containing protein n=1 Tax=Achlya hypogyna TaxID=1202772 RepID=A0A1V9ZFR1_ACHHY|nr:hypothetical protein ACHHYP_13216 [Achlya hypogyna]
MSVVMDTSTVLPRTERRSSIGAELHVHVRRVQLAGGRKVFTGLLQQHGLRCKCYIVAPGRPATAAAMTEPSLQDPSSLHWEGHRGLVILQLPRLPHRVTLHVEVFCGSLILASTSVFLDDVSKAMDVPATWYALSPDGRVELGLTTAWLSAHGINNEAPQSVVKAAPEAFQDVKDAKNDEDDDQRDDDGAPSPEKCVREDDFNNDGRELPDDSLRSGFDHHVPRDTPVELVSPSQQQEQEAWHIFRFGIAAEPPHPSGIEAAKKVVLYDPCTLRPPTLADDRRRLLPCRQPPLPAPSRDVVAATRRQRVRSYYGRSDLLAKPSARSPPPPIILREQPPPIGVHESRPAQRLQVGRAVAVGNVPGVVRFIGATQFAAGLWVGVELRLPVGKNNGSVNGTAYFKCAAQHGLFIRASHLGATVSLDPAGS